MFIILQYLKIIEFCFTYILQGVPNLTAFLETGLLTIEFQDCLHGFVHQECSE